MRGQLKRAMAKSVLAVTLAVASLSCGRSENVGWADRELPDSTARAGRERAAAAEAASQDAALSSEYEHLAQSLSEVQGEAIADPEFAAKWQQLVADVDAVIVAKSEFHRELMARRDEIDSLVARSRVRGGEQLTREQTAELARHYRNIQTEMARVREIEFRGPQFRTRFSALQAELFARMRALAPERVAEIDRYEELELRRSQALDSVPEMPILPPAVPPGR